MRGFWLLVHFIGFMLWLGGGIATMIAGVTAKPFPAAERLAVYRALSAVQRLLVGPGAVAVVISGLMLIRPFMKSGEMPTAVGVMMVVGVIGAMVAIGLSVPAAAQLGRLKVDANGQLPERFVAIRKRQVIVATAAGSLGLLALWAATVGF
jgi:hypothetical protein